MKKYGKEIVKNCTQNVFGEWYTLLVLDDKDFWNVHIICDRYRDDELNTLKYQEPKECVELEKFNELSMTQNILQFALWNRFYGYDNKTYTFSVTNEVDINDLENFY